MTSHLYRLQHHAFPVTSRRLCYLWVRLPLALIVVHGRIPEKCAVQNDTGLKLEIAMKLNGLEKSELFWEKALDTKMLVAWNDTCMVLVFRGTASVANALADLQVRRGCALSSLVRGLGSLMQAQYCSWLQTFWTCTHERDESQAWHEGMRSAQAWRVVHPPKRGSYGRRPLVHSGFNRSWIKNNLNGRIIDRVLQIVKESPGHKPGPDHTFKIMVTGEHQHALLCSAPMWRAALPGRSLLYARPATEHCRTKDAGQP